MTDWADEIAKGICDGFEGVSSTGGTETFSDPNPIAAALRKAKADGMVEAADLIRSHRHAAPKFYWKPGEKALFNKIDSLLRDNASKLDPPTD